MNSKTYNYELPPAVVEYLVKAVNSVQIRGEQAAKDMMTVLDMLRHPKNIGDLEKDQLEVLKAKYEPIKEEKKK